MNFKKLTILAISSAFLFTSCNNDDDNTETILGLNYEKMLQALNDLGFIPSATNISNHD